MADHQPAHRDPDGFPVEELIAKHLPGLRAYVAGRVDRLVHAKESNADIVQSVCREVLEHIARFEHRSEAGFKQWLYRTAERKIIDRYRYYTADKRDAAREVPPLPAGDASEDADILSLALRDAHGGRPTPSHEAIAREELLRTSRAFEGLPAVYREVILLSRVHGLPHAEIAHRLGKSEGAVRTGMKGGKRESNHTRMGKQKFEALIRETNERGVNTFDLADLYGTHPYVIPALKGIQRDKYDVISKIWFRDGGIPENERPDADVVIERFLRELKTDYIDLVLLHCVTSAKWPEELRKQMDLLSKLKAQGKVRALGVWCHSLEALELCATEPWVESVHTRINPYGMSMDGPPEKVVPVLKKIHAAGKGVVGMKIIGEGRLRNDPEKRQASIKFALELGCVDVLNVGCESIAEVEDLAASIKNVQRAA